MASKAEKYAAARLCAENVAKLAESVGGGCPQFESAKTYSAHFGGGGSPWLSAEFDAGSGKYITVTTRNIATPRLYVEDIPAFIKWLQETFVEEQE